MFAKGTPDDWSDDLGPERYSMPMTFQPANGEGPVLVQDGELVIEEFYTDYFGREQSESVSMKLQKGTEGESL